MNIRRYNKAVQGGLGAMLAGLIGFYFDLPHEVTSALAVIGAALLPRFGPKNAEPARKETGNA